MILITAYSLILGLNFAPSPEAAPVIAQQPIVASANWASGPAEPISLIAGDELGLALFTATPMPTPPKLLARIAAANTAPPSWTVMPSEGSVHFAATQ